MRIVASALKTLPLLIFMGSACAAAPAGQGQTVKVDIASQPLGDALSKFAEQTGLQLVYHSRVARGLQSPRVVGTFTTDAALTRLLSNTGLSYEYLDASTVAIRAVKEERSLSGGTAAEQMRLSMVAEEGGSRSSAAADDKNASAAADVLVQATRVMNADIARTIDDPKAYYIFDAATIERSGATSIEDFLNRRLTMSSNYVSSTTRTVLGSSPYNLTTGTVAMRGLNSTQTLVLVNGRRLPMGTSGVTDQPPDLNSIPLGMIDRIEVMPSSGSGIYGAGAMGGVINIITKRGYTGGEVRMTYDNSFDTDTAKRRVDANYGFMLEGGRTQVTLSAGYSDADFMVVKDRLDIIKDNYARVMRNNPAFLTTTSPVLGTTPRVSSSSGGPLVLRSGQSLGSSFVFLPRNYRGPTVDGTAVLVTNAGRLDTEWPDTEQFSHGLREPMNNLAKVASARAEIRRQMLPWMEVYFEGAHESNSAHSISPLFTGGGTFVDANVPNNPFNSAVIVAFPFDASLAQDTRHSRTRAAAGVTFKLPRQWLVTADYSWNRGTMDSWAGSQDLVGLIAAMNSGQVNLFTDLMTQPNTVGTFVSLTRAELDDQHLYDTTVRAAGPLGRIFGLEPTVIAGLQHRDEGRSDFLFTSTFPNRPAGDRFTTSPGQSQTVKSIYAEFTVPLVAPTRSRAGLRLLDLQLTGRRDQYTVHANRQVPGTGGVTADYSSTNPTYGMRYKPFESLMLRAAYTKGFLAPTYSQLTPNVTPANPSNVFDPLRNNQGTAALVYTGGNTNLQPETGENWTAGVIFTPAAFPGLRMALDYVSIRKQNNIANVTAQLVVTNESLFPGRVTRAAPVAGDPFGVGRITSVDATVTNLFATTLEAYDVSISYRLPASALGNLTIESLSSIQPHYLQRIAFAGPMLEYADTPSAGGPLHFKSNLSLTWERQNWQAGWTMYYFDAYKLSAAPLTTNLDSVRNQGGREVPSQTSHDLFVSYQFGDTPGTGKLHALLDRTQIQLGIRNVFNTRPAFDGQVNSPFFLSPYMDYRLATYALTLRRDF